jgi:urease accessory protein
VVAERRHVGPLQVQKPLYPEDEAVCHGIVLHPPAGIVGGDELELRVAVGEKAAVVLTTPGAAKWYRSTGAQARQSLSFEVGPHASLEWLPQPSIAFDRALGRADAEIILGESACYIGWEMLCLGRTASGERLNAGRMLTRLRIVREGKPIFLERASIEGGSRLLDSAVGLAGQPITGTLVASASAIPAELLNACRAIRPGAGRAGVTRLPGVMVARYLGDRVEAGQDYFVRVWQQLRPALIGREARPPRIWRT